MWNSVKPRRIQQKKSKAEQIQTLPMSLFERSVRFLYIGVRSMIVPPLRKLSSPFFSFVMRFYLFFYKWLFPQYEALEDVLMITIVIKQEEAESESIQRLVDESVHQYKCTCQIEPRVCLEIKSQDISKFIDALKHTSKDHRAEKEKPQVSQHQESECEYILLDQEEYDVLKHTSKDHRAEKEKPQVSQHQESECEYISLDQEEYDVLRYLYEDFITSNFTDKHDKHQTRENSVVMSVLPKLALHADQLQSIRTSLRKEEMYLSSLEFEAFTRFSDTTSTDRNFYILPKRNECKVTLYAKDYQAMTKARHVVSVKTGKIKTTSRDLRKYDSKFDPTSDSGDAQQSSVTEVTGNTTRGVQALSGKTRSGGEINNKGHGTKQPVPSSPVDLLTKSGIQVSVYKADITQLTVDAIVNAANERLQHGGGVASVIAKAAGADLELEGDDFVKQHGPLSVTQVVPTKAGNLPCGKVLHAVGPRWNDYQDKTTCLVHLEQTVFNCLKTAHDMKFSSIAVSSISSAIFGVPKDLCAKMYLAAVQRFDINHGSSSSLRRVHFVDVNDEMVGLIQETFSNTLPRIQQLDLETKTKNNSLQSSSIEMQLHTVIPIPMEQDCKQIGGKLLKQEDIV